MRALVGLKTGQPFVPAQLAADRDAVLLRYLNLGFENVNVDVKPDVSRDGTRADLLFTVREGPQVRVDHVIIVGNARTEHRDDRTRNCSCTPAIRSDARRCSTASAGSRRSACSGASTSPRSAHGDERRRDLLVSVEEASMTTIAYGGGLEGGRKVVQEANGQAGERFEFAPRASVELARRNLFGKNRSATLFASGSLPLQVSGEPTSGHRHQHPPVSGRGHLPRAAASSIREADAFLDVTFEQQIRSSFDFRRRSRQRRARPATLADRDRQRQLSDSAHRGVQQQRQLPDSSR